MITLDRDFGNVLRFPPENTSGIVILEMPHRVTPEQIQQRLRELLTGLEKHELGNELWIVEPNRIRIHEGGGPSTEGTPDVARD
ncbi:MAG: DUF5615 family PIN-like protein [Acidobacteriota bacterium]